MKVKPRQYAQSLFESVKDASDSEAKKIVKNLARILVYNNQSSQMERVVSYFNALWNKEKNIVEAEIITANPLDAKTRNLIYKFIEKKAAGRKIVVKEKIVKGIMGGFIVRLGDETLDSSMKTKLSELNQAMH